MSGYVCLLLLSFLYIFEAEASHFHLGPEYVLYQGSQYASYATHSTP